MKLGGECGDSVRQKTKENMKEEKDPRGIGGRQSGVNIIEMHTFCLYVYMCEMYTSMEFSKTS